MAPRTCGRSCAQLLRFVELAFLTGAACTSAGGRPDGNSNHDASGDLAPGPTPDGADDTGGIDTLQLARCDIHQRENLSPIADTTPCSFATGLAPDDAAQMLAVYLNGLLVPNDTTDGWSYGSTNASIVFAGSSCDTIISDPQNSVVQIVYYRTIGPAP